MLGLSMTLVSASGSSFRVCLHQALGVWLPHLRALSASVAHTHSLGVLGQAALLRVSFWLKGRNRHKLDEVDLLCGLVDYQQKRELQVCDTA